MTQPQPINLTEYQSISLHQDDLPDDAAEVLWRHYRPQVSIEPPSFITGNQWRLQSQGWVGHLPITQEFSLNLQPKVPLANLFGMYEYAYQLQSFHFLNGIVEAASLQEFYENLAAVLAHKVLDRGRRGFYRSYLAEEEQLPYVRGRMDMLRALRTPWKTNPYCHYEEHTANIDDNQILAWSLWTIVRSGLCTERIAPLIRNAYRSLQGITTLEPFSAEACAGRLYNRLNQDYHPMHALSRFFLEQTGPSHKTGNRHMIPFIVDMARLFERFVAEWLRRHLPHPWRVKSQQKIPIGHSKNLYWQLDLSIENHITGNTHCVIDTKYKRVDTPSPEDIAQIVAYAHATDCRDAILIYPTPLAAPLDVIVGHTRVRTLTFDLNQNLETSGKPLLNATFGNIIPAHN